MAKSVNVCRGDGCVYFFCYDSRYSFFFFSPFFLCVIACTFLYFSMYILFFFFDCFTRVYFCVFFLFFPPDNK
ncbi:hypothetical protein STCU_12271 [Strigomonas culicis]|uniref:Uncharacterized protein n=1 Tax=Strigomonas culicis TaxID=28005 RepID=S9TFT2_9TRYP|nr:hypothetical protein STCU_12271 [Strigomonas culicis]|eukprot:EPY15188.1 hypothetical protein STCU_12271 [Strigomonas culicis]